MPVRRFWWMNVDLRLIEPAVIRFGGGHGIGSDQGVDDLPVSGSAVGGFALDGPTGVVGAVAGTLLLVNIPERPLVIAVIVAIVGYVVLFFAHPELRVGPRRSKRLAPVVGVVAGVFQGAVGISGPIVGSWIHSYRLDRGAHILSVTSLFFITGLTQLVVLVASGELSGRVLATLLACVPVLLSIPIGTRLRNSVTVRGFDLAIVGMLAVSALALTFQTFS